MTVEEAINQGIRRIRLPEWDEETYIELDLVSPGQCMLWATSFGKGGYRSSILSVELGGADRWEEYLGPVQGVVDKPNIYKDRPFLQDIFNRIQRDFLGN